MLGHSLSRIETETSHSVFADEVVMDHRFCLFVSFLYLVVVQWFSTFLPLHTPFSQAAHEPLWLERQVFPSACWCFWVIASSSALTLQSIWQKENPRDSSLGHSFGFKIPRYSAFQSFPSDSLYNSQNLQLYLTE